MKYKMGDWVEATNTCSCGCGFIEGEFYEVGEDTYGDNNSVVVVVLNKDNYDSIAVDGSWVKAAVVTTLKREDFL